jgi:large subunit ribosomal protein L13
MTLVIDAENMVVGRIATETASILLKKKPYFMVKRNGQMIDIRPESNELVYIVNAEKAILSGNPKVVTQRYLHRVHIKTNTNPWLGPFHPRTPEKIIRRAVRGMLPRRRETGKSAYRRLRVYVGVPAFLAEEKRIVFEGASADKFLSKRITVGELARRIGTYTNRVKV